MRRNPIQTSRRLRYALAYLALAWMQLNVLCNPFSPNHILRWLRYSNLEQSPNNRLEQADDSISIDWILFIEDFTLADAKPAQPEAPIRLELPPEMDDLITIRPRMRLSLVTPPIQSASITHSLHLITSSFCLLSRRQDHNPGASQPETCRLRC